MLLISAEREREGERERESTPPKSKSHTRFHSKAKKLEAAALISTDFPSLSLPMAATAALRAHEGTPPPVIAKAGRYTVFITPPATPTPSEAPQTPKSPLSNPKTPQSPNLSPPLPPKPAPLVQVPPPQFEESKGAESTGAFGFFWDAVAKVQDVHSSLDGFLAEWFGLDQSKYQWALNDYYESRGEVGLIDLCVSPPQMDKECGKKEVAKVQNV